MKPIFKKLLELRDSDDEKVKRDADNVYNRMGENLAVLMADDIDYMINDFVDEPTDMKIRKCFVLNTM